MFNFDSLWYHMPFAADIAQSHSVTGFHHTETVFANWFYPQNSELLHAVGILVVERDTLSLFINYGWLAIALLAAWCIGRPYGRGHLERRRRRDPARDATSSSSASPPRPRTTSPSPLCCSPRSRSLITAWAQREAASGEEAPAAVPRAAGRLAARRRRARGRPRGGHQGHGPRPGRGAERRGDRARAGGAALGRGGLVVRAGPARRRLLVPAQPDRGRQPDPGDRPPRPALAAPPRAPADRRPDFTIAHYATDTGVWSDYFFPGLHDAFGGLWPLVPLGGRWPARPGALGRGRNQVRALARRRRPLRHARLPVHAAQRRRRRGRADRLRAQHPLPAAGAARRRSPCCRCRACSTTGAASGACSGRCSCCSSSPTAPTRSSAIPRASSASAFAILLVAGARGAAGAEERPRPLDRRPGGAASPRLAARRRRDRLPAPARLPRRPLPQRRARRRTAPGLWPRLRLPLGAGRARRAHRPGRDHGRASSATASTGPTSPTGSSTSAKRARTAPSTRSAPAAASAPPSTTPSSTTSSPRPSSTSSTATGRCPRRRRAGCAAPRRSDPVERSGDFTIWRVSGRLDPEACGPANAPLRDLPDTPGV